MASVSRTLWSVIRMPIPSRRELPDDLLQVEDRDRVDPGERLVEEEETRRERQRAGDLEAPPLAAGERVGDRVREVRELEPVEELVRPLEPLVPAIAGSVSRIATRFSRAVIFRKTDGSCGQVADAPPGASEHRQLRDLLAVEEDVPRVGLDEADDDRERRRLPGAVRPEEADDLSPLDLEARRRPRRSGPGSSSSAPPRVRFGRVSRHDPSGRRIPWLGIPGPVSTSTRPLPRWNVRSGAGHTVSLPVERGRGPPFERDRLGLRPPGRLRPLAAAPSARSSTTTLPRASAWSTVCSGPRTMSVTSAFITQVPETTLEAPSMRSDGRPLPVRQDVARWPSRSRRRPPCVFGSILRLRRTARTLSSARSVRSRSSRRSGLRAQDVLLLPGRDVSGEEDLPLRRVTRRKSDSEKIGCVRGLPEEARSPRVRGTTSSRFRPPRSSRRGGTRSGPSARPGPSRPRSGRDLDGPGEDGALVRPAEASRAAPARTSSTRRRPSRRRRRPPSRSSSRRRRTRAGRCPPSRRLAAGGLRTPDGSGGADSSEWRAGRGPSVASSVPRRGSPRSRSALGAARARGRVRGNVEPRRGAGQEEAGGAPVASRRSSSRSPSARTGLPSAPPSAGDENGLDGVRAPRDGPRRRRPRARASSPRRTNSSVFRTTAPRAEKPAAAPQVDLLRRQDDPPPPFVLAADADARRRNRTTPAPVSTDPSRAVATSPSRSAVTGPSETRSLGPGSYRNETLPDRRRSSPSILTPSKTRNAFVPGTNSAAGRFEDRGRGPSTASRVRNVDVLQAEHPVRPFREARSLRRPAAR